MVLLVQLDVLNSQLNKPGMLFFCVYCGMIYVQTFENSHTTHVTAIDPIPGSRLLA